MMPCRQIVTSLAFFLFIADLEQSGSRPLDAQSVKLSLKITFYLTKSEYRTKKSLTQLSHQCFELRYYFCQKILFFLKKNANTSKIKRVLVLEGIVSKTTYVCVLTYQISIFWHNSNEFQVVGGVILTLLTSKRTPKKPSQIRVNILVYFIIFQM